MSGFSSDAGSILDYASPRQWGKVRLPSQSRFEVHSEADGVIVREWLEAKASAFLAMAIAVFTFVTMFVAASATRRYEWDAGRIEDIRIRPTTTAKHRNSLGKLEIRISDHSMVKLFTDHSAAELHDLGGRLREAVGLGAASAERPDLEASHEPD